MAQKRHLIILFFSFLALSCWAEEMSYAAKTFRSNIQSFLREEGFAPSVDNDGSLCFKKEGTSYWIDVLGDKPFYVTFHREPIGTEDASSTKVLKAINDVNTNIRAIKCCYMSDHVSLAIESYCYVAEDFKYVFYQYLSILEASNELVKEAYSKYDTSASTSSHGNSGNKSGTVHHMEAIRLLLRQQVTEKETLCTLMDQYLKRHTINGGVPPLT